MTLLTQCPCQSGLPYADCCAVFHQKQQEPANAEQLMRSRYTAYTQADIDYIVDTTVPALQPFLDREAIANWAKNSQWLGLKIICHQPNLAKWHSLVEFEATFNAEGVVQVHHERSLFVKILQKWYFVDPNAPAPSAKSPCFCGSGKKFKYCCGAFYIPFN